MMQALSATGGNGNGPNALVREAVAAILNANDEDVIYFRSADRIKMEVGGILDACFANPLSAQAVANMTAYQNLLSQNNNLGLF